MIIEIDRDSMLQLSHLVVRAEADDEFVVGDLVSGVFFSVPPVGARIIELLRSGETVADVERRIAAETGDDVDVLGFAQDLAAAGLVGHHGARAAANREAGTWVVSRVPARFARPLFSPPAWVVYGACLIGSLVIFAVEPGLLPTYEALFFLPDVLLSMLLVDVMLIGTTFVHEVWHALAGAALGVPSRLRVSRRALFLVFETDLTGVWARPVAKRYGPFLAGLAVNAVMLFVAVGLRFAWSRSWIDLHPVAVRALGALVMVVAFGMAFQGLAFLRTDLYMVLVTALGARNLHRITLLGLRSSARLRLTRAERAELTNAHPRDRTMARWYRMLYLLGICWTAWFFYEFGWPSFTAILSWIVNVLRGATPASVDWWKAVLLAILELAFIGIPMAIFVRERLHRRVEFRREAGGA
jgi:hypothetical protein